MVLVGEYDLAYSHPDVQFGLLGLDCPKSSPQPGRPRSGPDWTPNVQVQVQIQVDLDPNYRSRSSW